MEHKFIKSEYHALRRVRGSKTVYQCADPGCTYRENKAFLLNKMANCHLCGKDFILSSYALTLSRPHCDDCTKGEKRKEANVGDSVGRRLLKQLGIAS